MIIKKRVAAAAGGASWPILLTALLVSLSLVPVCAAPPLASQEQRGKRIYTEGKGRKPIHATLMGPGIKAPGTAFPCLACHRDNGEGQLEGGVRSSNITYFNLTKQYTGLRPSGRSHPPYTDEALMTAITNGLDPAGNHLNPAHPTYEMDTEDLRDLVAYLKILGREPVPGVTDNEIRIGSLLPESGPLAEAASDITIFLTGYFAELNARGGLYSRQVRFVPLFFDPAQPGASAAREEVFCLVANLGVPPEDEALDVVAKAKVPVVAPLMVAPETAYGMNRNTFYVHASVRDQARVLVDYLAADLEKQGGKVAVLYAADESGEGGAAGVREQAGKHDLTVAAFVSYSHGAYDAPGTVHRLKEAAPDAVLFFGEGADAAAFLSEAGQQGWQPLLLTSAAMAGAALFGLPPGLTGKVFLASPVGTPDLASRGMADFRNLLRKYPGTGRHTQFLATVFAGAAIVEKGLTDAGRNVSRSTFVDAIGKLYEFHTGVTPPLTYNENRRVGARGASILRIDGVTRRFFTAAGWREPKQ